MPAMIQYVWSGNLLITDAALCKFYGIHKWEDIPRMQRELKSTRYKEISMICGESQEVRDMMDTIKIQDLKKIALRNYTNPRKMIGNKSYKKTWVKEVLKVKKRGYNTFVVGVQSNKKHPLRGQVDVLLMIQNFV